MTTSKHVEQQMVSVLPKGPLHKYWWVNGQILWKTWYIGSNIYTTCPSGLDSRCGPFALVWGTLSRQSPIKEPLPKIQGPIWGLEDRLWWTLWVSFPMTSHTVYRYVDNYFTSFRLIEELGQAGHDCTGTIRADRVEKAPLINPKELYKQPRGSYDQVTDQKTNIT